MTKKGEYDLIIIGAGPAAFGCSVYSTRYNLRTLVIGKISESQLARAPKVQNYLGMGEMPGFELLMKFKEHAESLGAEILDEGVTAVEKAGRGFKVSTNASEYRCNAVLLAMGMQRKSLGVKGEDTFLHKGISYCATCDGPLFSGKDVAVVGGSDAAATSALLMAEYAKKVYLVARRDVSGVSPHIMEKIRKDKKIELLTNVNVLEAFGSKFLEGIKLGNGKELKISGLFVEIGGIPSTEIAARLGIALDAAKSIIVNAQMETNVKGVYAAGDVTKGSAGFRQIILAVAEGAIAARSIYSYLRGAKTGSQWG